MCAVAVIFGHVFPVIYGFRGGKGVATGAGAITAISPIVGLLTAVVAFSIIGFTKKVSLGSLAANFFFPIMVWKYVPEFLPYAVVIVVLILVKHRTNVLRLIKGEESKIKL
jgi:glycerol-3-phosphate acyltransferase PlsY